MCTAVQANFDGISFAGQKLSLKRPNDYVPPPVSLPTPPVHFRMSELGVVSGAVPDGPGKVFIGGLPYTLQEDGVTQLLEVRARGGSRGTGARGCR